MATSSLVSYAGVNPQQIAGAAGAPVVAQDKQSGPEGVVDIIQNAATANPATVATAAAGSVVGNIGNAVLGPITEVAVTVVLAAAGVVLIILAVAKLADTGAAKALGSSSGQLVTLATTKGAAGGGAGK